MELNEDGVRRFVVQYILDVANDLRRPYKRKDANWCMNESEFFGAVAVFLGLTREKLAARIRQEVKARPGVDDRGATKVYRKYEKENDGSLSESH